MSCDLGVVVITDRCYNIYNADLDYNLVDIQNAKTIVNCGSFAVISSDVQFVQFEEELLSSLKQKKLKEVQGKVTRLVKVSESLICFSVNFESFYSISVFNVHTMKDIALVECEKVECLLYWDFFQCIVVAGTSNNEGFLEFYNEKLDKIVKHEFPLTVTAVCANANVLFVAASYILLYFQVANLECPVKICTYKAKNRVNDMVLMGSQLFIATEGDGIIGFCIRENEIEYNFWSVTHFRVKTIKCLDSKVFGIGLDGNFSVIDYENSLKRHVQIGRGGRSLVFGSAHRQNLTKTSKNIINICCLNGEIIEIDIDLPVNILNTYKAIYKALQQEFLVESENSQIHNLNLIGYYYKLNANSQKELEKNYPDIEEILKEINK